MNSHLVWLCLVVCTAFSHSTLGMPSFIVCDLLVLTFMTPCNDLNYEFQNNITTHLRYSTSNSLVSKTREVVFVTCDSLWVHSDLTLVR